MSETLEEVAPTETEIELANTVGLLENRITELVMRLDDIGWNPLGVELDSKEIPLDTVKSVSNTTRALVAINPLVKHGITVRTSYIWGKGVHFQGLEDTDPVLKNPLNQKWLFSSNAFEENEKCLATDGNFYFLATGSARARSAKKAGGMRVPITQITGIVTNPDNPEDVWFYRREWTEIKTLKTKEGETRKDMIRYYPSDLYDVSNGRPRDIQGIPVVWDQAMIEHSVNKQVGWRYGLPDAMSIVFWAKAHKEFLEDSAKLVKAYSRFAFKATSPTPKSVKAIAAKIQPQTQRDALGRKQDDVGNAFVGPQGSNLQVVGRTAGSVDFSAGNPLAGYVASGLEIPLNDLLSDASLANRSSSETLAGSKLKAMESRQESWAMFFERLFTFWGKKNVTVSFPKIEEDPAHRRIQSVVAAAGLNVLHAEEVRDLFLAILDIKTEKGMPSEEELGNLILQMQKDAEAKQAEQDAAEKMKREMDPSYGDNDNREEIGAHEYDPSDGNAYK